MVTEKHMRFGGVRKVKRATLLGLECVWCTVEEIQSAYLPGENAAAQLH